MSVFEVQTNGAEQLAGGALSTGPVSKKASSDGRFSVRPCGAFSIEAGAEGAFAEGATTGWRVAHHANRHERWRGEVPAAMDPRPRYRQGDVREERGRRVDDASRRIPLARQRQRAAGQEHRPAVPDLGQPRQADRVEPCRAARFRRIHAARKSRAASRWRRPVADRARGRGRRTHAVHERAWIAASGDPVLLRRHHRKRRCRWRSSGTSPRRRRAPAIAVLLQTRSHWGPSVFDWRDGKRAPTRYVDSRLQLKPGETVEVALPQLEGSAGPFAARRYAIRIRARQLQVGSLRSLSGPGSGLGGFRTGIRELRTLEPRSANPRTREPALPANPEPRTPNPEPRTPSPEPANPEPPTQPTAEV